MTTQHRQQRLEELFLAASELKTSQRRLYLDAQCEGDAELRKEIDSLLSHAVEDEFLDSKHSPGKELLTKIGADLTPADEPTLENGTRIGAYTVRGIIGSGGMGMVYVAEQEMPRRTVALKLVRAGSGSDKLLRRFEYEAELLGRLQHPGIAQIYEAGRWSSDGATRPFIAMELVRGLSLTMHAERHRLPNPARLELLSRVCEAVQYAHRCGVIHRDLKPANILVNESGDPKILDFGVARALDTELGVTTMQTGVGQIIGTLPYMSPEQVAGDPAAIDTRTDVYALGVILYELLTGTLPHDLRNRSLPEAARIIRDETPRRLSSLDKSLRGDLEKIVATAIEKDRTRRYQSASELGEDLRRFVAGDPIHAKHDSAFYVLRKQLRRYRHAVAAGVAFILALLVFSTYSMVQRQRALAALTREADARRTADAQRESAVRERERAETQRLIAEREKSRADREAGQLRRNLYVSAIAFAQASYLNRDVQRMKSALASCPEDLRGWEWHYLHRLSDISTVTGFAAGQATGWTFSPDGTRAVGWTGGNHTTLHDASNGAEVWCDDDGEPVIWAAYMPDSSVFVLSRGTSPRLEWRDGRTGDLLLSYPTRERLVPHAFTADGTRMVCRVLDDRGVFHSIAVIDPMTGGEVMRAKAGTLVVASISPDGTFVSTGSTEGWIQIFSVADGSEITRWKAHDGACYTARITPDGANLITSGIDMAVRLWNIRTGESWATLRPHINKIRDAVMSPDGTKIASVGTDMVVQVTDLITGEVVRSFAGHERTVSFVSFAPDGRSILSGSSDHTFRRWRLDETSSGLVTTLRGSVMAGSISPDGKNLLLGLSNGELARWTPVLLDAPPTSQSRLHRDYITFVSISHDSRRFVTTSGDGTVKVWDVDSGSLIFEIPKFSTGRGDRARTVQAKFSPSNDRVAISAGDGQVLIVNSLDGANRRRFRAPSGSVGALAWSPDGARLATSGYDLSIRVWEVDSIPPDSGSVPEVDGTIRPIAVYSGAANWAWSLDYSPDGSSIVSACEDGVVRVWDVTRGGAPRELVGHFGPVYCATFSPDGTRLATGGWDNTARVWDFTSGQEMLNLRGHVYSVWVALFTPDGRQLITASNDGDVRRWTALEGDEAVPLYE